MARYPSLEDNYTPIPTVFLDQVFHDDISREELVVMLLFFHHTYGWKKERAFLQLSTILKETDLSKEKALKGVSEAMIRKAILAMPMGEEDPAYLLNTAENERFLELYGAEEEQEEKEEINTEEERLVEGVAGGNLFDMPPPQSYDMPSEETVPVVEDDSLILPMENDHGTIELESETISVEMPIPNDFIDATDPIQEVDPIESIVPPIEVNKAPAATSSVPKTTLPFAKRSIEMLTRILGRWPTKDESARLVELSADDTELIEAMSSLLSKTDNIYSSDLIVYEVESIRSQKRRLNKKERSHIAKESQLARQKECRKCNGLGYIFMGVNEIRECTCRKLKDK